MEAVEGIEKVMGLEGEGISEFRFKVGQSQSTQKTENREKKNYDSDKFQTMMMGTWHE